MIQGGSMADQESADTPAELEPKLESEPRLEEPWPLQTQLDKLEGYDVREVEGRARLGALAFGSAPDQLTEIIEILRELRLEPWDRLDPNFAGDVTNQLNALNDLVDTMLALTAAEPDAQTRHAEYEQ